MVHDPSYRFEDPELAAFAGHAGPKLLVTAHRRENWGRRLESICHGYLERGLQIRWGCEGRVDSAAVDQFPLMSRANCGFLAYGVEAGTQKILDRLVLRDPEVKDELMLTLAELRDQIDKLDDRIINLLVDRMQVAEKIGTYKKENNITILQTKRWDDMLKNRLALGMRKGLSEEFITKLFRSIHQESINHQTQIMNQE